MPEMKEDSLKLTWAIIMECAILYKNANIQMRCGARKKRAKLIFSYKIIHIIPSHVLPWSQFKILVIKTKNHILNETSRKYKIAPFPHRNSDGKCQLLHCHPRA